MCVSLAQDVRDNVHKLPATVHFASPSWLDLSRGGASKYDRISEKPGGPEGIVVRGLKNLTVTFAQSHGYPGTIRSWKAPYTNVMYVNLKWLRNASTITAFTQVRLKYVCLVRGRFARFCGAPDAVCVARTCQAVVASGCIYGNRWGDLPLWGAALLLAQEPQTRLKLPYYHGSHKTYVN